MRLETMQAVQHASQWRLEFEPATQFVTIHSIKIRRENVEVEHAGLDKIRILQRESGLEGFIIDGAVTLLLVLEDVRPGDILEWSYTIENQPRLLPEHCTAFFTLPIGSPVGKFHFSLQFHESRQMKWKSASPDRKPAENTENQSTTWVWQGENLETPEPEDNTPEWHLPNFWIQISNCPDWSTIATAFCNAWKEEPENPRLSEIIQQIKQEETDLLRQIEKAIRLVQDEHRYLSVNLELGGQVPTAPETVLRRRYGDCKDLSFLLTHLLKRLGIPARPILVNTRLRKSIASLLPMVLFDHAVVEYQVQGETRWVDATLKKQGGGPLNRIIFDFALGLPVDTAASGLIAPPPASVQASLYEVKETILVDTTGKDSLLSVVTIAHGRHADLLRHDFETQDIKVLEEKRLQACANRFFRAGRIGSLKYRDDRDAGEFVVAEVFAINGFLTEGPRPETCIFHLRPSYAADFLGRPEIKPGTKRQTPFALPHPYKIVHTLEVQSPGLHPEILPAHRVQSRFVYFSRAHKGLGTYCLLTFSFNTLVDSVPADQVADYRKTVEEIWAVSSGRIHLMIGYAHPKKRRDFGELPLPSRKPATRTGSTQVPSAKQPVATTASKEVTATPTSSPLAMALVSKAESISKPVEIISKTEIPKTDQPSSPKESSSRITNAQPLLSPEEHRSQRKRKQKKRSLLWPIIIGVITISLIIVFIFALRRPPQ